MKKNILLLFLFAYSILSFGQEKENLSLLKTDATWRQEAFNFPFPFAKEIDLEGIVDVRFSKGWADKESPDFWTYAFGWEISIQEKLTEEALENYMRLYLDGLMKVVNREDKVLPKTIASFIELPNAEDQISYKGNIKLYDAFFTKRTMILNVTVDYSYCKQKNKSLMLFRLSPQNRGTDVWLDLAKVKFKDDICSPSVEMKK